MTKARMAYWILRECDLKQTDGYHEACAEMLAENTSAKHIENQLESMIKRLQDENAKMKVGK